MKTLLTTLTTALLFTACGQKPDACDAGCDDWADFVEACADEWLTEYSVSPDCLTSYSPDWYDDNGKLKSDDEAVWTEYLEALVECSSWDVTYENCIQQNAAKREATQAGGTYEERQATCEEENPTQELMDNKDCAGWLAFYGIIDPVE